MALLLVLSAVCGGFILLTAVYSPLFAGALVSLGALLVHSLGLLRQSQTDPLTGLYNLYRLEAQKKRYQKASSLWVFYFDLNRLKQVNDSEGHAAGDLLLRETARFLQTASGKHADAYRVGGDEFLLVFKSGTPDTFLSLLENAKVPASYGAAHGPGNEFAGLVARAEQAMYASRKL